MEMIILKIILCSGIVLGLYYLFLANEKTFTFNRFYLLLGLIFSYTIPFVAIETKEIVKEKPTLMMEQEIPIQVLQDAAIVNTETLDYAQLLFIIYFAIAGILIAKMLYSILKIKTLKGRKIIYQNQNVILLEKEIAPFSFLNTIYLSEKYFKDKKIDERIFLHEEIHVKQNHSFDVLFIEVVKAFSWFNPIIYLYKNVMITNHEFIADEEVINQNENIKNYQELILNEALKQQNLQLTHQFNFNNTKKRFIMMTKRNSKFAEAKKFMAIPAFAALALLFAERVYANNPSSESLIRNSIFSENPYVEFKQILSKYSKLLDNKEYAEFEKTISEKDLERLSELYPKLSNRQQEEQPFLFLNFSNYKKIEPTEKQLSDFSNDQKYFLFIDGNETRNSELKKYKSSDFSYVSINNDISESFVTLMTNEYFKKHVEEKKSVLGFISNEISPPVSRKKLEKDTISPKKNIETKLVEKKNQFSDSDIQSAKTGNATSEINQKQEVSTLPEYPGGINAMRQKVSSTFNGAAFKGDEGIVKSNITFTINEKGEVSNIRSTGNNEIFNTEAIRAVKLANENITWKPATKDDNNVAYRFQLPLTMKFETFKKAQ